MTDSHKFKALITLSAALIGIILVYSLFGETMMSDINNYLQRRAYYESVISKKGLSLHKGVYWKDK